MSPIVVNGVMYVASACDRVAAIEPETGKELWSWQSSFGAPATRGLEYWAGDKLAPPTLYFGTDTGQLVALNAKTGKLVPGFGKRAWWT